MPVNWSDPVEAERAWRGVLAANRDLLRLLTAVAARSGGTITIRHEEWEALRLDTMNVDTYVVSRRARHPGDDRVDRRIVAYPLDDPPVGDPVADLRDPQ